MSFWSTSNCLRNFIRCTVQRDWIAARLWGRLFIESFKPLPF